jgi:hypothetical protein
MESKPDAPTREVAMRRYAAMGLILGLLSAGSRAEPLGGYFGGSVGGRLDGPLAAAGREGLGVEGSEESYRLVGGWELGRYAAVEATYFDAGSQRLVPTLDFGFDVDFGGYSAALVGRLPFGRFSTFARVGALWWEEEGEQLGFFGVFPYSRTDESLLLGAGTAYELHRSFALRAEWERFEVEQETPLPGVGESRDQLWFSALVRF